MMIVVTDGDDHVVPATARKPWRSLRACVGAWGSTVNGDRRASWSGLQSCAATTRLRAGARMGRPNPKHRSTGSTPEHRPAVLHEAVVVAFECRGRSCPPPN